MARSLPCRRTAAVTRRSPLDLEALERRDCPAVVGVVGGGSITEGGGPAYLTVALSAAERRPVQVGYIITGDGTSNPVDTGDYRLSVGTKGLPGRSGTIEFRPGETVRQVRIDAVDDALREGVESLRFTLFRPRGCMVDPANGLADVAVRDNDDYTAAIVPIGPSDVAEGESARFAIQLSAAATRAETFYVSTVDGTATSSDYRPLRDMPVTILAGQSQSQPFALSTLVDDVVETDEYFLVSARPRSADMPAIDPVGVTIKGTGPAPVTVSVTDTSVVEGNSGLTACMFTIRLGAPALDPIVVQYATQDGTATGGVDYVAASGSLTFARGQISKTVTVNVIGDTVVEENETFQLIATVTGVGVTATGTASIQDDDSAFEITLTYDNPSLPTAQRSVFQRAVQRLQSIIVGDVQDVTVGGRVIDDIEIKVYVEAMSASYNGYAMATAWRPGPAGLAYQGEIHINSARMGNPGIYYTIIHEMLHALGFSSNFFTETNTISGLGTTSPLFTGSNAVREYASAFRLQTAAGVPLYEDPSAQGSYASHWSTAVFGTEIMSVGWDTMSTGLRPFSRITAGVLQDIGYRVNYSAADFYAPPADVVAPRNMAVASPRGVAVDTARVDVLHAAASWAGNLGAQQPAASPRTRAFGTLRRT